jgi:hypothetical protein
VDSDVQLFNQYKGGGATARFTVIAIQKHRSLEENNFCHVFFARRWQRALILRSHWIAEFRPIVT